MDQINVVNFKEIVKRKLMEAGQWLGGSPNQMLVIDRIMNMADHIIEASGKEKR